MLPGLDMSLKTITYVFVKKFHVVITCLTAIWPGVTVLCCFPFQPVGVGLGFDRPAIFDQPCVGQSWEEGGECCGFQACVCVRVCFYGNFVRSTPAGAVTDVSLAAGGFWRTC